MFFNVVDDVGVSVGVGDVVQISTNLVCRSASVGCGGCGSYGMSWCYRKS